MWLQLSQILKKFTEGNVRKPAFIYYTEVTKIRKTRVGHARDTRGFSFKHVLIWRHVSRARRQE